MKKLITIILSLFISFHSYADDGLDAYNRGDYKAAFNEWSLQASQGNSYAQFNIGFLYANGQGVKLDHEKAAEWYMRAAAQGSPVAQYELGLMKLNGINGLIAIDYKEAVMWFVLAVKNSDDTSSDNALKALEWMYVNVDGAEDLVDSVLNELLNLSLNGDSTAEAKAVSNKFSNYVGTYGGTAGYYTVTTICNREDTLVGLHTHTRKNYSRVLSLVSNNDYAFYFKWRDENDGSTGGAYFKLYEMGKLSSVPSEYRQEIGFTGKGSSDTNLGMVIANYKKEALASVCNFGKHSYADGDSYDGEWKMV